MEQQDSEAAPVAVQSVEDAVYERLRSEILQLELEPGRRLQLDDIARRYGVSQTPVRLALTRLDGQGLVERPARRGTRAAPLRPDELEEIQALRIGVEGYLARVGAPQVTGDGLDRMLALITEFDEALGDGDLERYLLLQSSLREVCYRAAHRPRLLRVATEQRERAERYIRFACSDVGALAESREHQVQLYRACQAGDGRRAERVTRTALLWTLERVAGSVDPPDGRLRERAARSETRQDDQP